MRIVRSILWIALTIVVMAAFFYLQIRILLIGHK